MIMNSRGKDVQAKQEGETTDSKIPKASSTSRQWGGFKNPRIVRVSRAFGGKDRHSKVCTIRGLRDRRIRLSVPTAIQLYDLQERLGLSQPSKVVDWLLDATKNEIDKLPPLQMPPGNFSQFHQPALFSQESIAPQASLSHFFNANSANMKDGGTQAVLSCREGIDVNDHVDGNDQTTTGRSRYWNSEAAVRAKCKEAERETAMEKDKWNVPNEQGNLENFGGYVPQLSAQNFFPIANQSSFPALLNNALPYNTYLHCEPSNLSLSQFGNHSFTFQAEDSENNHSLALPSQVAISSGSQLYFCPSVTTVPSIIPPYPPYMNTSVENEARQINHLQVLSSSSQHVLPNSLMPTLHLMSSPMKSFASNVSPKLPPQENDDSQLNKGDSGS